MDIKTQRIAEAQRLNALDDLQQHLRSGRSFTGDDKRRIKAIIKSVSDNKPEQANRQYGSLDTSPREAIPESFDDWLRTTAWSQKNA